MITFMLSNSQMIEIMLSPSKMIPPNIYCNFIVTDSVGEMCVDPGEMGAILEAGGVGGPGLPGGGKGEQLALDSGGG